MGYGLFQPTVQRTLHTRLPATVTRALRFSHRRWQPASDGRRVSATSPERAQEEAGHHRRRCMRQDFSAQRLYPGLLPYSTATARSTANHDPWLMDVLSSTTYPPSSENYVTDCRVDGRSVQLALWDTAGRKTTERLRPLAYAQAHVILIGFSVDAPDSLDNVRTKVSRSKYRRRVHKGERNKLMGVDVVVGRGSSREMSERADPPDRPEERPKRGSHGNRGDAQAVAAVLNRQAGLRHGCPDRRSEISGMFVVDG